jgi:hypothetical protein
MKVVDYYIFEKKTKKSPASKEAGRQIKPLHIIK